MKLKEKLAQDHCNDYKKLPHKIEYELFTSYLAGFEKAKELLLARLNDCYIAGDAYSIQDIRELQQIGDEEVSPPEDLL
jgi:hypothetical protein